MLGGNGRTGIRIPIKGRGSGADAPLDYDASRARLSKRPADVQGVVARSGGTKLTTTVNVDVTLELDLSGKTAIITGAGRGIGEEIATHVAAAGADVVVAARTESEIAATVERIEKQYGSALAVLTDLGRVDDIGNLVEATESEFGAPDIVVNNAAANLAGDPLRQSAEDVDTMLDVNLRGLFLLSQRAANAMLNADVEAGRIINVSSIVGHLGVPAMTVYGGTKAGVYGITRGLAAELAPHDITVNSVSPGMTRTERIERLMEEKGEIYDLDRIPMGDLADPEDVANACVFLASDRAGYITGVDLPVDGGVTITAGLYR